MEPTAKTVRPPISWVQNKDFLYVIVDVECKDIEYDITENAFTFKGTNALDASKKYEVTLNFLHPVNHETVSCKNIGRCIEYKIYKKESGPFWKSLTNDKTKLPFLKPNFLRFYNDSVDEDEKGPQDFTFNDVVNTMDNNFDDFSDKDDSDDSIPSLS